MRAKDIANLVYEPDWDNSDASSDDEDYSPLRLASTDRIEQAENSTPFEEELEETQETATASSSIDNSSSGNSMPEQPPGNPVTPTTGPNSSSASFQLPHQFSEPAGPATEMDSSATAMDFFDITFGNDIMEMMVEQTNLYAQQNPPSARYRWYDTTVSEMYLFLGVIIAMGVHLLPSLADY